MVAEGRTPIKPLRTAGPDRLAVLVSEIACALPGCPPLETVVAFWIDDRRYHLKMFKPVAAVNDGDLPPAWLLPSLAVPEDFECDCC